MASQQRLILLLKCLILVACGTSVEVQKIGPIYQEEGTNIDFEHGDFFSRGLQNYGWERLPIRIVLNSNLTQEMRDDLELAAGIWNEAVGMKLMVIEISSDNSLPLKMGTAFPEQKTLVFGHPDFAHWHNEGRSPLASVDWDLDSRNFVVGANLAINIESYDISTDGINLRYINHKLPDDEYAKFITVMVHELGHVLGLSHVDPAEGPTIMSTLLSSDLAPVPGERDINLVREIYSTTGTAISRRTTALVRAGSNVGLKI